MRLFRPTSATAVFLWQMVAFGVCIVCLLGFFGVSFYLRSRTLMGEQIRDKLRVAATMAATQFDADSLRRIRGVSSLHSPDVAEAVRRLRAIRDDMPSIRYAYLLRRVDQHNMVEFIADADSLASRAELDRDRDGVLGNDEQPSLPGDLYDAADSPAMLEAFFAPAVDPEVTVDQWGSFISGYAPVRDAAGDTVAVLGMDMRADEFFSLTNKVFSPVALLLFVVAAGVLAAAAVLFLWRRRVLLLQQIADEHSSLLLLLQHQVQTPIAVFRWSLETLEERCAQGNQEVAIQELRTDMGEGMDMLMGILTQLEQALRVEEGTVDYRVRGKVSLQEMIEGVAAEYADRTGQGKRRITVSADEPMFLRVDRKLIEGVLRELLENAISYSPPASAIHIVAKRGRREVEIEVRDEGCGIPEADRARLFQKFMRGTNAFVRKPHGNGLGLFIARGVVRKAGGDMRVESTENKGTSVFFTLPIVT